MDVDEDGSTPGYQDLLIKTRTLETSILDRKAQELDDPEIEQDESSIWAESVIQAALYLAEPDFLKRVARQVGGLGPTTFADATLIEAIEYVGFEGTSPLLEAVLKLPPRSAPSEHSARWNPNIKEAPIQSHIDLIHQVYNSPSSPASWQLEQLLQILSAKMRSLSTSIYSLTLYLQVLHSRLFQSASTVH